MVKKKTSKETVREYDGEGNIVKETITEQTEETEEVCAITSDVNWYPNWDATTVRCADLGENVASN